MLVRVVRTSQTATVEISSILVKWETVKDGAVVGSLYPVRCYSSDKKRPVEGRLVANESVID